MRWGAHRTDRAGVILALALAVSAIASLSFPVASQAVADAYCAAPPDTELGNGSPTERFAETFSPINGGFLTGIRFFVDEQAHGGNYVVQITPVNSSDLSPVNPEVVMTEATIPDSSIPLNTDVFHGTEVGVDFPTHPAVSASSEYTIVFKRPGSQLGVGVRSHAFGAPKDPCPDGAIYTSPDDSSPWEKFGEGDDIVFTTFVGGASLITTPPLPIPPPVPPAPCTVPNLIGKKLKAAKKALAAAECKLGSVTKKEGATGKTGKVKRQSPKAGKVLAAGSRVNVTLKP